MEEFSDTAVKQPCSEVNEYPKTLPPNAPKQTCQARLLPFPHRQALRTCTLF